MQHTVTHLALLKFAKHIIVDHYMLSRNLIVQQPSQNSLAYSKKRSVSDRNSNRFWILGLILQFGQVARSSFLISQYKWHTWPRYARWYWWKAHVIWHLHQVTRPTSVGPGTVPWLEWCNTLPQAGWLKSHEAIEVTCLQLQTELVQSVGFCLVPAVKEQRHLKILPYCIIITVSLSGIGRSFIGVLHIPWFGDHRVYMITRFGVYHNCHSLRPKLPPS